MLAVSALLAVVVAHPAAAAVVVVAVNNCNPRASISC
jgi:hypothetical protein